MSAADHTSTVREALEKLRLAARTSSVLKTWCDDALAALDALQAQAEATAENGRLAQAEWKRAEAAEAERDRLRDNAEFWRRRCEANAQWGDRLRDALREIAEYTSEGNVTDVRYGRFVVGNIIRIARAALAGEDK